MDHSQKCYEQFTGSYSKKNREEKDNKPKPQVNRFVIKTLVSPYKQIKVEEKIEAIEHDLSQELDESDQEEQKKQLVNLSLINQT